MLGISEGYYNTLKFFHVLAAITWVGSAIYAQALATKVLSENDPVHLARTAKDIGDLGKRVITPASISVLVFGIWIVAVSRIDLVVLVLVVADMVFKPGT